MKRLLSVILCCLLLCGCSPKTKIDTAVQKDCFYGIWVTYAELQSIAENGFTEGFEEVCINSAELGATALFVHVRAFCDSVYPSQLFPMCDYLSALPYDPLEKMITLCKKYGLEFHAWINPYRVSTSPDIALLDDLSPAKKDSSLLLDFADGLYLDPSNRQVRKIVLEGIKEIADNYDIDGIHFDDYFYPTTDENCDAKSYAAYKGSCKNPLPLDNFRRVNVTLLVSGVASYLKSNHKDISFTISPAADIERNYTSLYADIKGWCRAGYLDAVIPQLYFGFNYPAESFCFERLLLDWINLTEDSRAKLYIGLAPYKLDTTSKPDAAEWANGTDIVARQITHIKNQAEVDGAVLFSYSYIFGSSSNAMLQKEEITKSIKE